MSDLALFQQSFARAISRPVGGTLRVYRNTVLHGAVEALRANYPVVARQLGEEMFESLAVDHASACPPHSPILALYGEQFPEWLEEQPWIREMDYLPDLARVERLHIESLFASDCEPLHLAELRDSDWNSLQLELHPSTRFDWFLTPAMTLWLGEHGVAAGQELHRHSEGVLFTRPYLSVWPRELDAASHRLLLGVANSQTVGRAALAAAQAHPSADIGALFASLVNSGTFAAAPSERNIR